MFLEVLYLFGGWDGSRSLADLWRFDITTAQWMQISADTSQEVIICACFLTCSLLPSLGWTQSLFMSQNVF